MIKIVSFWRLRQGVKPEDAEKQYFEVHVPLARKVPGLRKYTIGKARGNKPSFYRMANCTSTTWRRSRKLSLRRKVRP